MCCKGSGCIQLLEWSSPHKCANYLIRVDFMVNPWCTGWWKGLLEHLIILLKDLLLASSWKNLAKATARQSNPLILARVLLWSQKFHPHCPPCMPHCPPCPFSLLLVSFNARQHQLEKYDFADQRFNPRAVEASSLTHLVSDNLLQPANHKKDTLD